MNTKQWFELALPNPNSDNFRVQLGCHFEEVQEMLESVEFETDNNISKSAIVYTARNALKTLANALKQGEITIKDIDVKEFVDSWGDQNVTLEGLAHIAKIPSVEVSGEIDRSNFSKFVNGQPVFDANGKIAKGSDYSKPNLAPYLPTKVFWK